MTYMIKKGKKIVFGVRNSNSYDNIAYFRFIITSILKIIYC